MNETPKELLTQSRMSTYLNCQRQHYYRYELGLRPVDDAEALRMGTAIHAVRQKRAEGVPLEEIIPFDDIETFEDAKVWALSAAYDKAWTGDADEIATMKPEIEFGPDPIGGSRSFFKAGKIDGLATLKDGRLALVEHKTTGEDISDGSDYWLRLSFNQQIYIYWLALYERGIVPDTVIYDVIRKPTIRPKAGETPKDYAKRILADATGEPVQAKLKSGELAFTPSGAPKWERHGAEWYFSRKHIAITAANLEEFKVQVRCVCHNLTYTKAEARNEVAKGRDPANAWPRNVNGMVCDMCAYRAVCHGRTSIDVANPPPGFKIVPPNEEISVTIPGPENDGMK